MDNLYSRQSTKSTELAKYFKNAGKQIKSVTKIDEEDSWHSLDEDDIDEAMAHTSNLENATNMRIFLEEQKKYLLGQISQERFMELLKEKINEK